MHKFDKREELVEELSSRIESQLKEAILTKGKASLIVSGGSTPKPLFERLRRAPIEWDKVTIGLCDERWVPSSHEDSNESFVKRFLLQDKASKAKFAGMYVEGINADEAEGLCSKKLKDSLWPFDVMILGMGTDAHTASLFPNNERLSEAFDENRENICISIKPKTAPHTRMSLSLGAILSSRHLYLHFEGKDKLALYEAAVGGDDRYIMPIRSVLNQNNNDIEVYFA